MQDKKWWLNDIKKGFKFYLKFFLYYSMFEEPVMGEAMKFKTDFDDWREAQEKR